MWFQRRVESLVDITLETDVTVRGRVVSSNEIVSPMTGNQGALFEWAVFGQWSPTDRDAALPHEELARGVLANGLIVETQGGRIVVPGAGIDVRFRAEGDFGEVMTRRLDPSMGTVPDRARAMLFYRELALRQGDLVRVTARVAPRPMGAPFRGAGEGAEFIVVGMAVVEDLSAEAL